MREWIHIFRDAKSWIADHVFPNGATNRRFARRDEAFAWALTFSNAEIEIDD